MTQNQYLEAVPLFESALVIQMEHHGADDSVVATTQEHLAACLFLLGGLKEAEKLARRAYATQKTAGAGEDELNRCRAVVDMCILENLRLELAGSKKDSPHCVHHRFGKPL